MGSNFAEPAFIALLEAMRQIEEETISLNFVNGGSHHPMRETREALEKLVARMDSLEADFDRLAEKSGEWTSLQGHG